jgi:asparagine synthase (glutamine-hydrolysing)
MRLRGSDFSATEEYLTCLGDTMAHRGPDGSGTWVGRSGDVGFSHRRLSIIDLSDDAAQPMTDTSGSLTIVFNGEIYNHAALRVELERLGHHNWQTNHSDTEVVLHAFMEWGIDCLQKFRGMFAFGLWDARSKELWLVRDRIGIKPLYYTEHDGRIVFASEIKALLADPDQARSVDPEALFHYLTFLVSPAPMTLFSGINKLPPGTWMRITPDGVRKTYRYWDVWDHVSPLVGVSDEEISERALAELRTAVELRKVSDRPVGVFLSGGVDSGTNVALFGDGETDPVRSFTVGYSGDNPSYENETGQARAMSEHVGSIHREILLSPSDVTDFLPAMVRYQDEPIADPVCVPVYYVSKLARESGVVVAQVGEGADELFHGYDSWAVMRRLQRMNNLLPGRLARTSAAALLSMVPRLPQHRLEYLRRGARGEPVFLGGAALFTDYQKRSILSPDVLAGLQDIESYDAVRPVRQRFEEAAWETSVENWMTYADLSQRLPELLLMRVDKMAMATGLEGRVPFLDHEFVTLAMSIPSAVKTRDGITKSVLKRAVRGVIPDEVIDRKKRGFGMPMLDWTRQIMMSGGARAIDDFCRQSGLIQPEIARRYVDEGQNDHSWTLLNLALWWHEYFGDGAETALNIK